ncbi:MAG TPA: redoxin domain-containing protein [Acidimicrobiia bacterium]
MHRRALAALEASRLSERALREGAKAPDFELPNAVRDLVGLFGSLRVGPGPPLVLPRSMVPLLQLGATTIVEKHGLTFPVLSDHDNRLAKPFNLVCEMTPENIENCREKGRDIPAMNGTDKWELPIPATFVIDSDRVIRYAFIGTNHRVRAEPGEVVAIAKVSAAARPRAKRCDAGCARIFTCRRPTVRLRGRGDHVVSTA